jgi:hypothetical protein
MTYAKFIIKLWEILEVLEGRGEADTRAEWANLAASVSWAILVKDVTSIEEYDAWQGS